MQLGEYLETSEIPKTEFARAIGVARQTLHRYIAGTREPSFKTLARIREVTGGQVTPDDFIDVRAQEKAGAV